MSAAAAASSSSSSSSSSLSLCRCNTGDSGFGNAFCQAEAEYLASKGIKIGTYYPDYKNDPTVPSPGSFFDSTPKSLDNDYYKLLKSANADRLKKNNQANPSGYLDCGTKATLQCQLVRRRTTRRSVVR